MRLQGCHGLPSHRCILPSRHRGQSGGWWCSSRRSSGGCIRRRPMLLTLSLSRARTGAVTQPRRVGSGSGRQRRDHPASSRLRPDRAGQVGLVRPPARSDLPGSSGQQAPLMSSLQPNQSYFAPRGDNSSRPLPNQPEVISTGQGVGTGKRPK